MSRLGIAIGAVEARMRAIGVALRDPQARQAAAMVILTGGGMAWTLIALVEIIMLRHDPRLFWLALASHVVAFVVLTGFGALLYKRSIRITRDGIEIVDADPKTATAAVTGAPQ